jgi:hypothetical protein
LIGFGAVHGRVVAATLASVFMLAVAGCQSGDSASDVLDVGGKKAPDGKVLESELRAYCPRVTLTGDGTVLNTYAKKAEEDPTKLIYQASLSTVTRKCTYSPGTIAMTVAVAGRIVPGPAAVDGTVKLPIRIEARQGEEVVYSNVASYEVAISKTGGATQFIYSDPNVNVPAPEVANVKITIGYDQGPEKKKKKADDEL